MGITTLQQVVLDIPTTLAKLKMLTAHGKRYGRLLSKFMEPGKVLDVGTAAGFILKGLSETGWEGLGIEPNASMAEYGRNHMGVDIEVSALEQYKSEELFNLVTMVQVLPHFYDLEQGLQNAANLTKPSGYWLIETWNKDSFIARLMGKGWHGFTALLARSVSFHLKH